MALQRRFCGVAVVLAGALLLVAPFTARAQNSSLNAYSPYSMYGIGDIGLQGPTQTRSMGATGVAYRSPVTVNNLNPASLGGVGQKAFLFDVGLEGANYYLGSRGLDGQMRNTSFNTFNIKDISLAFPVGRGVGFSVSMTPFSEVGYRIERMEDDPDILSTLGQVKYTHIGQGGITQYKAGLGVALTKRFSLGANLIYYKGEIDRMYYITVLPTMTKESYNSVNAVNYSNISKFYGAFGFQWNLLATSKRMLSLGATYQPGGKLGMNTTRYIPSSNMSQDTIANITTRMPFKMPSTLRAGVCYANEKWLLSADYIFQNWSANKQSESPIVKYVNTNSVRFGAEITPNRGDFRHTLNRWSYRAGLRYDQYYMDIRNTRLADAAVTFGVGIPIKMGGPSSINIGVEAGRQGRTTNGLVQTNYFKILLSLSMFGDDFWFVQPKYD
ncbi:hypothetical protein FACS1894159_06410 [Bacteroidia bacterium]|nr:hypothetical protein FACS1894159_06410 [Bacteroidia bacterium]